jgi:3-oxoacyl-[acyl-carrier protein] reductase
LKREIISMASGLAGQAAIVTGAGSAQGIGLAIARPLFEQGAIVAVTATGARIQERAKELDPGRRRAFSYVADLTEERQVREFVAPVDGRLGRIDILVNNAGMARDGRQPANDNFESLTFAEWQEQIAMTLNTAFLMTREVLPLMRPQKYGRIVNISSVTGPLVSNMGSRAYGAAKGAMEGMMRGAAIEDEIAATHEAAFPGLADAAEDFFAITARANGIDADFEGAKFGSDAMCDFRIVAGDRRNESTFETFISETRSSRWSTTTMVSSGPKGSASGRRKLCGYGS